MFVDMPLPDLREYRPVLPEPPDFDAFWHATLEEARKHDLEPAFHPAETALKLVEVYDAAFNGFGGHRIHGWLVLPVGIPQPLPCLVQYIGYGGGRGLPHEWTLFPSAGYAMFVMDSRGQGGGGGRPGATPDPVAGTGPETAGLLTRGVLDPADHYYRRLFTDAVRAVEAARSHPAVDPFRIVVTGASQGGASALAAAGLLPDLAAALIDVPFMADVRRAVEITDTNPYAEVSRFLAAQRDLTDRVLATLDYFDVVNFAARATVPALFSIALRDATTPASTCFAAHNHYAGPKDLRVWPFNGHEGGGVHQQVEQMTFLRTVVGE